MSFTNGPLSAFKNFNLNLFSSLTKNFKTNDYLAFLLLFNLVFPGWIFDNIKMDWKLKIYESPRVIDRGTSAHFCVSDQYLISKVLRIISQSWIFCDLNEFDSSTDNGFLEFKFSNGQNIFENFPRF